MENNYKHAVNSDVTLEELEEKYERPTLGFKRAKIENMEDILSERPEMVNHPNHYNVGRYECIDVMVDIYGLETTKQWCIMNAFKYLYRTLHKNGLEDIKKAHWYLEWVIDHDER